MKRYVVFNDVAANDVNMQSAWWVSGYPALHAFYGFAEVFTREYGFLLKAVAVIHHDSELLGEKSKGKWGFSLYKGASAYAPLAKRKGDDYSSKSKGVVLSALPVIRGRLRCSVVAEYDDNDYSCVSDEEILAFVNSGRVKLGGGDISCARVLQPDSLKDAKAAVQQAGFQLVDRSDLVEKAMQVKKVNAVEAILGLVSRGASDESWLFPLAIGYHGISTLKERKGSREEGVPHAFVEPLVGLVQCVSLRKDRPLALWRPCSDVSSLLFYFKEI